MLMRIIDTFSDRVSPVTVRWFYEKAPGILQRNLALYRFRQTVRYVAKHSPFYRRRFAEAGIDARRITKPSDMGDFFTTPDDIVAHAEEFICQPPSIVFESSGTSGRNKRVYYSKHELETMGVTQAAGLRMMGLTAEDRVANAFDFSIWIPGMITHYGLMAAGNFCLAFGKVDPIEVYRRMKQYGFTVVMGEPTWLIRLTELAEKHGSFPLKLLIGGAEEMPADAIPWMEQVWSPARVKMCYGTVEQGSALGFQPCDDHTGYHLDNMDYYPEIIEADDEGYGEMVFTTLIRRTMPLIRYRSRDITRFQDGVCSCGCRAPRIARLRGRRDELVIASGGNLYPLLFANVFQAVPAVGRDWQVVFKLEGVREIMELNVESTAPDEESLMAAIQDQMTHQYPDLMKNLALGIFEMRLKVHAPGTLRSGRKLRRLIDRRHVPEATVVESEPSNCMAMSQGGL
jgi:phenylacetate-CoA ligase